MEENCIFCKIVKGVAPCYKGYEDEHVLAFLDINPLMEGHALVIPKEHYVTLDQVPGELAGACMAVVPKLARALMEATGTCGWNILQNNGRVAGQEVFHVHFHVVPRKRGDSLSSTWCGWRVDALKKTEGERLSLAVQQALLDRSEKNEAEGKTETKK